MQAPEIRALRPEEASGFVACLRRCYGDSYLDPSQYDAALVAGAVAAGRRRSIVAVTADGEVVGHMGISLRRPGDNTADAGMTLVDPRFRGRGLSRALGAELARQAIALGLVGVHDYPVTVHGATQRIGAGLGTETGLLLRNVPADVEFAAMATRAGASDSIVRYLPLGRAPARPVHWPAAYAELLASLSARAGLERRAAEEEGGRGSGPAELEVDVDARRDLARVAVARVGSGSALLEACSAPRRALHVDLPLGDPGAPAAVAALRARGFFYGGLLPEFRDGDVLRMQRLAEPPDDTSVPVLESAEGRELARFVLRDARSVSG